MNIKRIFHSGTSLLGKLEYDIYAFRQTYLLHEYKGVNKVRTLIAKGRSQNTLQQCFQIDCHYKMLVYTNNSPSLSFSK